MVACTIYTNPTDTICIEEDKRETDCPILSLFAVHETEIDSVKQLGYTVTEKGFPQADGSLSHLAFSKEARGYEFSQSPIIGTELNTQVPCFGPDRERLVIGKENLELVEFPIENEDPIGLCPEYDWKLNGRVD